MKLETMNIALSLKSNRMVMGTASIRSLAFLSSTSPNPLEKNNGSPKKIGAKSAAPADAKKTSPRLQKNRDAHARSARNVRTTITARRDDLPCGPSQTEHRESSAHHDSVLRSSPAE